MLYTNVHYFCNEQMLIIMARPKRRRKMYNPPHFKGFRPIGTDDNNSSVVLNYEEYEAIRLSDFELMSQVEASKVMEVSRPTFTRIYESARRKVAQAFVLGKAIVFEGGKVFFNSEWYSCQSCGCSFNHPAKENDLEHCPLCGSKSVEQYTNELQSNSSSETCVCPVCSEEKVHKVGWPCQKVVCDRCNVAMMKKENHRSCY